MKSIPNNIEFKNILQRVGYAFHTVAASIYFGVAFFMPKIGGSDGSAGVDYIELEKNWLKNLPVFVNDKSDSSAQPATVDLNSLQMQSVNVSRNVFTPKEVGSGAQL